LLFSAHHAPDIQVGLRNILVHPEVGDLLVVETLPVTVRLVRERYALFGLLVHPDRVNNFLAECLVIGRTAIIVTNLWHICLLLANLEHFVLGGTSAVVVGEGACVGVDVGTLLARGLRQLQVCAWVPEGRLYQLSVPPLLTVSGYSQVKSIFTFVVVLRVQNRLVV